MSLIDRIRDVLEFEPDAPLCRVCICVSDSRPEMVATLMRMAQLAAARCRVSATPQPSEETHHSPVRRGAIAEPTLITSQTSAGGA